MEQYEPPLETKSQELTLAEKYKKLVGQAPSFDMTPQDIEEALKDPQKEHARVMSLNLKADGEGENLDYFPRKSS